MEGIDIKSFIALGEHQELVTFPKCRCGGEVHMVRNVKTGYMRFLKDNMGNYVKLCEKCAEMQDRTALNAKIVKATEDYKKYKEENKKEYNKNV